MTVNQKIILRLLIIVAAVLFLFALATANTTRLTQGEAFSASLKLNQGRFSDPNLIQPGDIVAVQTSHGVLEIKAEGPQNGRHDCIWRIVERGLQEAEAMEAARLLEQLKADNPAPELIVKATPTFSSRSRTRHLWWLGLLPAFIFGERWRKVTQEKKKNPDNYPPIGPNLTEAPMTEVVEEIAKTLEPGLQILDVQRLYLKRTSGPQKISVTMNFADGVWREVWLYPGESICLAKVKNKANQISRRWFRSACTNGMFSGLFGHLELPEGWSLVLQETVVAEAEIEALVEALSEVPSSLPTQTKVEAFVQQMTEEELANDLSEKVTIRKRVRPRCRLRRPAKKVRGCCFKKHLRGPRNRQNQPGEAQFRHRHHHLRA